MTPFLERALLGLSDTRQRAAVVAEARTWLRTPYHHQARVKGAGIDCAMLLAEVYHAAGITPHIDPEPYAPDWNLHRDEERYLKWVLQFAAQIQGPPLPGDIVLWKFGRCFAHGAIVEEWPLVIHALYKEGKCTRSDATLHAQLINREMLFFSMWGRGRK